MFNFEFKFTIQAETIEAALKEAARLTGAQSIAANVTVAPPTPVAAPAPTAAPAPLAVVPTAPPVASVAPVVVSAPAAAPVSVPTTGPSYTFDQLAQAAATLADAGKREAVLATIKQFGVDALTALSPEYYGAFALKLRELGAQI